MKRSAASVLLRTATTEALCSLSFSLSRRLPAAVAVNASSSSSLRQQQQQQQRQRQRLSSSSSSSFSTAVASNVASNVIVNHHQQEEADVHRHCRTCTCDDEDTASVNKVCHWEEQANSNNNNSTYPCGHSPSPPPPLPSTTATSTTTSTTAYSVRRRVIPKGLTSLNTPLGQQLLVQALQEQSAACYIPLTLHFSNQSDPAFCGVTTLLIVLNAFSVDPQTRWKGGWRYFGDEESLTARCCLSTQHIREFGITMEEFLRLAQCQGLVTTMKRAAASSSSSNTDTADTDTNSSDTGGEASSYSLDDFRRDVQSVCLAERNDAATTINNKNNVARRLTTNTNGICVVSFGRAGLHQTGDGHFSPIAAYHQATDRVLILDVARFKYPPYWVKVQDLYNAMSLHDAVTQRPRGWYVLRYNHPKKQQSSLSSLKEDIADEDDEESIERAEDRRPAHLVPPQQQASLCPLHRVKVEYCQNNNTSNNNTPNSTANGGHSNLVDNNAGIMEQQLQEQQRNNTTRSSY